jgi:hypothetical protein
VVKENESPGASCASLLYLRMLELSVLLPLNNKGTGLIVGIGHFSGRI